MGGTRPHPRDGTSGLVATAVPFWSDALRSTEYRGKYQAKEIDLLDEVAWSCAHVDCRTVT
jgi:hypothetical protein